MKNCTKFFTQEQIDEIRRRLASIFGVKDSLFDRATYIADDDQVAIVQLGKNKIADILQIRDQLFGMDNTPTPGSEKAVTSNGIYEYIQDIIQTIVPSDLEYLYIQSDSEMFDCLINGPGVRYLQSVYNLYCELIFNALKNNYFIIIDNALCKTSFNEEANSFGISCISDTKQVAIAAYKSDIWHKLPGTVASTSKYLIDNFYLRNLNYVSESDLNATLTNVLQNYITWANLNNYTDNYPTNGSSHLVTSNGIYNYVNDVIENRGIKPYLYIKSDSEMFDYLINGVSDGRSQSILNIYCDLLHYAVSNDYIIIIDDAICKVKYRKPSSTSVSITLDCISSDKCIKITMLGGEISNDDSNTMTWTIIKIGRSTFVDYNIYNINTSNINEFLSEYATLLYVDNKVNIERSRINNLSTELSNFRTIYNDRMDNTPKYYKVDWMVSELDELGIIHWTLEKEDLGRTPEVRFSNLWRAIRNNYSNDETTKIITLWGSTAISMTADNIPRQEGAPYPTYLNCNEITLQYISGIDITTYTIVPSWTEIDGENRMELTVSSVVTQLQTVS